MSDPAEAIEMPDIVKLLIIAVVSLQHSHPGNRFALLTAYDAHYLAVAEHLGAAFWTADRALAHAVQPELNWVHLVMP
ncbi:MAG: type II toxin-antitoxin system VapC family toxin [Anaerolineae bacterium]|nr:type II toxin-antitoxin system VapC family toxin [Anaerolineae bacterium]